MFYKKIVMYLFQGHVTCTFRVFLHIFHHFLDVHRLTFRFIMLLINNVNYMICCMDVVVIADVLSLINNLLPS